MLTEYSLAIIALIVVLVILIIVFVLQKKKEPLSEDSEAIEEIVTHKLDEEDLFGEEAIEEQIEIPTRTKDNTPTFTKREIPPHGEISRENFKEFAGERVLVAEDNLINQKIIKGLLADTGIEVVLADDGQIALDILERDSNFLMVLMDVQMPRVDGFEATRQIRANPNYNHIVVVALSGDTAADNIEKMKVAGMSEQLEKPLKMTALYDILYAYTGH